MTLSLDLDKELHKHAMVSYNLSYREATLSSSDVDSSLQLDDSSPLSLELFTSLP